MVKSQAGRFEALDSLRGICALLVALFHLKSSGYIAQLDFIKHAWLFVDFFFVLSGFVIAASYAERLRNGYSVARFMALRLGRVYPLHVFVLAIYVLFEIVKLMIGPTGLSQKVPWQSPNSMTELAQSLGMVHIFGIQDHLVWNVPSWSIAAEVWTYLIMALVLATLRAKTRFVMPLFPIIGLLALYYLGSPYLDRTYSFSLIRCLSGFALGMMAFDLHKAYAEKSRIIGNSVVEIVTIISVIAFVSLIEGTQSINLLAPLLFTFAVLVFSFEGGIVSRLLMRPLPLMLGVLSYSIYMIHTFVEARVIDVLNVGSAKLGLPLASVQITEVDGMVKMLGSAQSPVMGDVMSLFTLIVIVIGSWFTYRFVETPCREFARNQVGRKSIEVASA